jgi:hypothetical protein
MKVKIFLTKSTRMVMRVSTVALVFLPGILFAAEMGRTSCPANFSLIGTPGSAEAFCISSKAEPAETWLNAAKACRGKTPKARLCSSSEWVSACVDGAAGPNNMTGHWEWVADLYDDHAQAMGSSGCDSFYAYRLFSTGKSRCCFN